MSSALREGGMPLSFSDDEVGGVISPVSRSINIV